MRERTVPLKSERTRERILTCATNIFTERGIGGASFVDIAECAGITSQAIYRYYANKQDLYYAAVERDLEELQQRVSDDVVNEDLPHMTGSFWRAFVRRAQEHPLSGGAIMSRDAQVGELRKSLPSTKRWLETATRDLLAAQKLGLVRADIDMSNFAESVLHVSTAVMVPLVFEGKFGGPEWVDVERVVAAAVLHPMPDFGAPGVRDEFEHKVHEVAASIRSS